MCSLLLVAKDFYLLRLAKAKQNAERSKIGLRQEKTPLKNERVSKDLSKNKLISLNLVEWYSSIQEITYADIN